MCSVYNNVHGVQNLLSFSAGGSQAQSQAVKRVDGVTSTFFKCGEIKT